MLALCAAISGCANANRLCIQAGYFEGDRIRNIDTGKVAVVKKRWGEAPACQRPTHPILADVEYE
jgi:hypothetical protein